MIKYVYNNLVNMKENTNIEEVISRIKKMELYFDIVKLAFETDNDNIYDPFIKQILDALIDYYDNGQWLNDFVLDEKGMIPTDLKRGVLSEDGVYNLLFDINEADKQK